MENIRGKLITSIIIIALVSVAVFYMLTNKGNDETPPGISISSGSSFKGMISGDTVCKIPGLYAFTDNYVESYDEPNFPASEQHNLKSGIHLYHADVDLTIKKILDYIEPSYANKVLIAHYNPSASNINKVFSVYPELEGQSKITDPNNYIIPANQGFLIMSCEDTKIWKVKDENTPGTTNFSIDPNINDNWILISPLNTETFQTFVNSNKNRIKSLWVKYGAEFNNFEKSTNLNQITLKPNLYMVWLKINPKAQNPAQQNPTAYTGVPSGTKVDSCNQCSGTCISSPYGYYCQMIEDNPQPQKIIYLDAKAGEFSEQKQTAPVTFDYKITGDFGPDDVLIWTWGDKSSETNKISSIKLNELNSKTHEYKYPTTYEYSLKIQKITKNPGSSPTITTLDVSEGTIEIPKISPKISFLNAKIVNYIDFTKETEVEFSYQIDGHPTPFHKLVWTWGDGETKSAWGNTVTSYSPEKLYHSYKNAGTYKYSLEVFDPDGKSQSKKEGYITIEPLDASPPKPTISNCELQSTIYKLTWQSNSQTPETNEYFVKTDKDDTGKIYFFLSSDDTKKKLQDGEKFGSKLQTGETVVFNFGDIKKIQVIAKDGAGQETASDWCTY